MRLLRGDVRYHAPRDRSPVPAVLVGALVLVTLVSAQLSIAGETSRSALPPAVGAQEPAGAGPASAPASVPATDPTAPPSPAASAGTGGGTTEDGGALPARVEVTFGVGEDAPSGDADALLGPVVAALLADPSTRVRVVGHAEDSGDPVLEEQLSLRRAQTVLDLLSERGMPSGRADVFGVGAAEAGGSLSGTDRRVTVAVVPGA